MGQARRALRGGGRGVEAPPQTKRDPAAANVRRLEAPSGQREQRDVEPNVVDPQHPLDVAVPAPDGKTFRVDPARPERPSARVVHVERLRGAVNRRVEEGCLQEGVHSDEVEGSHRDQGDQADPRGPEEALRHASQEPARAPARSRARATGCHASRTSHAACLLPVRNALRQPEPPRSCLSPRQARAMLLPAVSAAPTAPSTGCASGPRSWRGRPRWPARRTCAR